MSAKILDEGGLLHKALTIDKYYMIIYCKYTWKTKIFGDTQYYNIFSALYVRN